MLKDYEQMVSMLMKKNSEESPLEILALGLAGEFGEVLELIGQAEKSLFSIGMKLSGAVYKVTEMVKKAQWHGKVLDDEKLINELGDMLWYVTALALKRGYTLEQVMRRNMDKLGERYPGGVFVEGGGKR